MKAFLKNKRVLGYFTGYESAKLSQLNELTGDHKDRPCKPNNTDFSRYSGMTSGFRLTIVGQSILAIALILPIVGHAVKVMQDSFVFPVNLH